MEKHLFTEYSDEQRLQMLKDNCEKAIEDYGYEKPLNKEQLKAVKDKLSSASVSLHDIREEKKQVDKDYTDKIKDYKATIADAVKSLKTRTTFCCEQCFEFIDHEEKKVGIYNRDGILVEERPATLKELREPSNMFKQSPPMRGKTGTDD